MNSSIRQAFTSMMSMDFVQAVNISSGVGSTINSKDYYVYLKRNGTYEFIFSHGASNQITKEGVYMKIPQLTPPNLTSSDYLRIRSQFEIDFENLVRNI